MDVVVPMHEDPVREREQACKTTDGGVIVAKGDIETYHEGGQWKNRPQGNSKASNTAGTKAEAQKVGRDMARDRGVEHVIKNMDGTIGARNSYGNDPKSSKG